jgi:outer membrane protein assembly factor BamE
MTRSQVRYILGTPLVADPFHSDRWDYVYQMQRKGETTEFRKIYLLFENDKLARIEGDVTPAASAADPKAGAQKPAGEAKAEVARPAEGPPAPQRGDVK